MKKIISLLSAFYPLALISPHRLNATLGKLAAKDMHVHHASDEEDDEENEGPWWTKQDCFGDPLPKPSVDGSTAIIPVIGAITTGLPTIFRAFGYADTAQIASWVMAAAQNPEISRILLKIDSPGGMVTGTPELANIVDAATESKEVIAHTSGMMDSAAYWIGSQADAVYCTASADVGCIGVYQMTYDMTGYLEGWGIKAEMIKSGDLKGTGHPHVPLSDAQRADIQKTVDLIGVQFRAAVTSKRAFVEPDSMRGQSFIGTEAAERGLVAGICGFESLLH